MIIKNSELLNKHRKKIRDFIFHNPNCTYKEIRDKTKIKIERIYYNMKEAFHDAGVKLPKALTKRSKEEQKIDVIKYIRLNVSK